MNYIDKSIAAGILLGIGDIVYMVSRNIYIGAMLFSLALLTIINSNLIYIKMSKKKEVLKEKSQKGLDNGKKM